jgi:hypothetical protein
MSGAMTIVAGAQTFVTDVEPVFVVLVPSPFVPAVIQQH